MKFNGSSSFQIDEFHDSQFQSFHIFLNSDGSKFKTKMREFFDW